MKQREYIQTLQSAYMYDQQSRTELHIHRNIPVRARANGEGEVEDWAEFSE